MEAKLTTMDRGEQVDAEEFYRFLESSLWHSVLAKIDAMIEAERSRLEISSSWDETNVARGCLKALRRVKDLPRIIRDEAMRR